MIEMVANRDVHWWYAEWDSLSRECDRLEAQRDAAVRVIASTADWLTELMGLAEPVGRLSISFETLAKARDALSAVSS